MKVIKTVSVIIFSLVLLRFAALLDAISFDFGYISEIGRHIPAWGLCLGGLSISTILAINIRGNKMWKIFSLVNAIFCVFVLLLELLMAYIFSQI